MLFRSNNYVNGLSNKRLILFTLSTELVKVTKLPGLLSGKRSGLVIPTLSSYLTDSTFLSLPILVGSFLITLNTFLTMSTTFTWKVANLERNVADGKVNTVHYTVNALSDQVDPNSESGGFYSAGAYGSIGLDGEVSVEFADLTEALVVEWVKTALGGEEKVAEIEAALQNQIDLKITPVSAAGVPW